MAEPQVAREPLPDEAVAGSGDGKREISRIAFPYDNLDAAIEIARAVHQLNGSESETEQVAAHLKQSPKSSSFRIQVASARTFGLVSVSGSVISLTRLGIQISDLQQEKAARSVAFLTVPLYNAVYEKFRGSQLPPDSGLEAAMVTLGVASKQKDRARQVFKKSAQQAGFFQFGTDRLVLPAIKGSAAATTVTPVENAEEHQEQDDTDKRRKDRGGSGGGGEELHPFIQGLLKELPTPKTEWPIEKRAKWLQTAANMFDMIYLENDEDSKRSINIDLKKDSAIK